jgi:hypothetical protein
MIVLDEDVLDAAPVLDDEAEVFAALLAARTPLAPDADAAASPLRGAVEEEAAEEDAPEEVEAEELAALDEVV